MVGKLPGGSRWEVELAAEAGGQSSFLKVFPGAPKLSSRQRPLHMGWGGSVFAAHKGGEARISVIANPRLPPAGIWCRAGPSGLGFVAGLPRAITWLVFRGPGFGAGRDFLGRGFGAGRAPSGQDLVPDGTLRARIWCRAGPPGQDLVLGGTLRARIWCRAEPSGLGFGAGRASRGLQDAP